MLVRSIRAAFVLLAAVFVACSCALSADQAAPRFAHPPNQVHMDKRFGVTVAPGLELFTNDVVVLAVQDTDPGSGAAIDLFWQLDPRGEIACVDPRAQIYAKDNYNTASGSAYSSGGYSSNYGGSGDGYSAWAPSLTNMFVVSVVDGRLGQFTLTPTVTFPNSPKYIRPKPAFQRSGVASSVGGAGWFAGGLDTLTVASFTPPAEPLYGYGSSFAYDAGAGTYSYGESNAYQYGFTPQGTQGGYGSGGAYSASASRSLDGRIAIRGSSSHDFCTCGATGKVTCRYLGAPSMLYPSAATLGDPFAWFTVTKVNFPTVRRLMENYQAAVSGGIPRSFLLFSSLPFTDRIDAVHFHGAETQLSSRRLFLAQSRLITRGTRLEQQSTLVLDNVISDTIVFSVDIGFSEAAAIIIDSLPVVVLPFAADQAASGTRRAVMSVRAPNGTDPAAPVAHNAKGGRGSVVGLGAASDAAAAALRGPRPKMSLARAPAEMRAERAHIAARGDVEERGEEDDDAELRSAQGRARLRRQAVMSVPQPTEDEGDDDSAPDDVPFAPAAWGLPAHVAHSRTHGRAKQQSARAAPSPPPRPVGVVSGRRAVRTLGLGDGGDNDHDDDDDSSLPASAAVSQHRHRMLQQGRDDFAFVPGAAGRAAKRFHASNGVHADDAAADDDGDDDDDDAAPAGVVSRVFAPVLQFWQSLRAMMFPPARKHQRQHQQQDEDDALRRSKRRMDTLQQQDQDNQHQHRHQQQPDDDGLPRGGEHRMRTLQAPPIDPFDFISLGEQVSVNFGYDFIYQSAVALAAEYSLVVPPNTAHIGHIVQHVGYATMPFTLDLVRQEQYWPAQWTADMHLPADPVRSNANRAEFTSLNAGAGAGAGAGGGDAGNFTTLSSNGNSSSTKNTTGRSNGRVFAPLQASAGFLTDFCINPFAEANPVPFTVRGASVEMDLHSLVNPLGLEHPAFELHHFAVSGTYSATNTFFVDFVIERTS